MLQNTDRGAPEPPTGSYSNSTSSDRSPDSFESGAASATDAPSFYLKKAISWHQ